MKKDIYKHMTSDEVEKIKKQKRDYFFMSWFNIISVAALTIFVVLPGLLILLGAILSWGD